MGMDIASRYGDDVRATADGIVEEVDNHAGYGRLIVIDHGFGVTTWYGHLSGFNVQGGRARESRRRDWIRRRQRTLDRPAPALRSKDLQHSREPLALPAHRYTGTHLERRLARRIYPALVSPSQQAIRDNQQFISLERNSGV